MPGKGPVNEAEQREYLEGKVAPLTLLPHPPEFHLPSPRQGPKLYNPAIEAEVPFYWPRRVFLASLNNDADTVGIVLW